jgi:hypothetical protein
MYKVKTKHTMLEKNLAKDNVTRKLDSGKVKQKKTGWGRLL